MDDLTRKATPKTTAVSTMTSRSYVPICVAYAEYEINDYTCNSVYFIIIIIIQLENSIEEGLKLYFGEQIVCCEIILLYFILL